MKRAEEAVMRVVVRQDAPDKSIDAIEDMSTQVFGEVGVTNCIYLAMVEVDGAGMEPEVFGMFDFVIQDVELDMPDDVDAETELKSRIANVKRDGASFSLVDFKQA